MTMTMKYVYLATSKSANIARKIVITNIVLTTTLKII